MLDALEDYVKRQKKRIKLFGMPNQLKGQQADEQ